MYVEHLLLSGREGANIGLVAATVPRPTKQESHMQADQLKQSIQRIEECADEAKRQVQQGSVPDDLRQSILSLHDQAKQAQQQVESSQQQQGQSQGQGQGQQQGQGAGQDSLRQAVMQMEQTGDRAMQACRKAGGSVDPQTQQSIQRLHDEVSSLKKHIQMG